MTKIKNETILGTDVSVNVDAYGSFTVNIVDTAGEPFTVGHGYTLDEAMEKAKATISKRKVRVEVPFVTKDGYRGVATGLHAGNGNILTHVGQVAMQLDYNSAMYAMRSDIAGDELVILRNKEAQIIELRREVQQIRKDYKMDLRTAVEAAIAEAQTKAYANITTTGSEETS